MYATDFTHLHSRREVTPIRGGKLSPGWDSDCKSGELPPHPQCGVREAMAISPLRRGEGVLPLPLLGFTTICCTTPSHWLQTAATAVLCCQHWLWPALGLWRRKQGLPWPPEGKDNESVCLTIPDPYQYPGDTRAEKGY